MAVWAGAAVAPGVAVLARLAAPLAPLPSAASSLTLPLARVLGSSVQQRWCAGVGGTPSNPDWRLRQVRRGGWGDGEGVGALVRGMRGCACGGALLR
ncbi:hypothetical protein GCM10010106_51090 [Thermopolyspora flexuosa]|nr:hypothetical protein GCM10010106_51090 [Thermopolyspora flexuosa]